MGKILLRYLIFFLSTLIPVSSNISRFIAIEEVSFLSQNPCTREYISIVLELDYKLS